jgi:hypothetical protein
MKKNSVGKVPIYTRKSLKEAKSSPLAHNYDTADFPGLVQAST